MNEIISLSEARSRGLKHFFTGLPCKNGHIELRYVNGSRCAACARRASTKATKALALRDPQYYQRRWLRGKYNLSIEEYQKMLSDQNGRCKTCLKEFLGRPHVDHCHKSGHVRGLLCMACNTALGFIEDDPETLNRMIIYLKSTLPQRESS